MAIYLNTNIVSMMAQQNLNNSQTQMATAIQQLSSGLSINSAKDNAAGYAIATVMGSQLGGVRSGHPQCQRCHLPGPDRQWRHAVHHQ